MIEVFTALRWSMQMAAWATPRAEAWSLERSLNRTEGERNLKTRNYAEAEKYLSLAVTEADERCHSVRKVQFRIYLAEAQRKQGKLVEAEETLRTALEYTARISNPVGYVQCMDGLAEVFHDGGNFAAMEKVLEEAVKIEASLQSPDPLRMARRVHRLGIARHGNGHLDGAVPALEKALALHEQSYGDDHIATANLMSDLGAFYRAQGNHEAAQQILRRALRIHEKAFGYDSPETVRDLHNLAGSLEEAGDPEAAAEQYERALLHKLRIVGGDLEELAEMQFSMATMYLGWTNYGRARELLWEALGIFKRKKGPRLAVTFEMLAHVEECSGRYMEAVKELAQAGKVWESCGAERNPELAENLSFSSPSSQDL